LLHRVEPPPFGPRICGVDLEFTECLREVSGNEDRSEGTKKAKRAKGAKAKATGPYEEGVLQSALSSAASKYDTLESYFERGEGREIKGLLMKEVVEDLGASSQEELRYVNAAVGKFVGKAYGAWKRLG